MATMKTIFILKCGSIFFLFIYSSVPSIPFHSPIHISHPIHSIHHSHPFYLSFPFMYPFHPSHWLHPCTYFTHSIHPFIYPIHSFYLFITFILPIPSIIQPITSFQYNSSSYLSHSFIQFFRTIIPKYNWITHCQKFPVRFPPAIL